MLARDTKTKTIRRILTLLYTQIGLWMFSAAHANLNNEINSIQVHAQSTQDHYHISSAQLMRMIKRSSAYQSGMRYANSTQSTQNPKGAATGVMVFVSLSMPDKLLQNLLVSAHQYHIPVVIRGLVHNNMRETLSRMFAIIHPKGTTTAIKGGFEINPLWFRAFDIQAVPTVVAIQGGEHCYGNDPCESRHFDSISGNIGLKSALEQIAQRGDARAVARWYLQKGDANANH